VGLGEPEGRERPAREQVGEPRLLLLARAVPVDRDDPQPDARLQRHRDGLVDARERLDREAQRHVVLPLPPDVPRERQAEQPELAHLRDDLHRQPALGVVPVGGRRDDAVGEVAHHLAELPLLVVEQDVGLDHDAPWVSGCGTGAAGCAAPESWGWTTATTWSRRTRSPGSTRTLATPSCGASSGCSIFMASTVTRTDPAVTGSPSATAVTTVPGIAARTSGSVAPGASPRARRRSARARAACALRSGAARATVRPSCHSHSHKLAGSSAAGGSSTASRTLSRTPATVSDHASAPAGAAARPARTSRTGCSEAVGSHPSSCGAGACTTASRAVPVTRTSCAAPAASTSTTRRAAAGPLSRHPSPARHGSSPAALPTMRLPPVPPSGRATTPCSATKSAAATSSTHPAADSAPDPSAPATSRSISPVSRLPART